MSLHVHAMRPTTLRWGAAALAACLLVALVILDRRAVPTRGPVAPARKSRPRTRALPTRPRPPVPRLGTDRAPSPADREAAIQATRQALPPNALVTGVQTERVGANEMAAVALIGRGETAYSVSVLLHRTPGGWRVTSTRPGR